jgi:hypothetical protein
VTRFTTGTFVLLNNTFKLAKNQKI